jgi:plastocyanin
MPLPLSVHSPRDLEFKAAAERQYLIFNLLAGGKLAWDQGHFVVAADRWESLLRLPNLDSEVAKLVRPLAEEARQRAGGSPPPVSVTAPAADLVPDASEEKDIPAKVRHTTVVAGNVIGGGSHGPGGAVVWLKRVDGTTPKPRPMHHARMDQADKIFVPHVLPVTIGSTVTFQNKDPIFHDVFSLNKPNDFDSGLFKDGNSYEKVFRVPGAVQVLCNIHASMLGYIVVVDSPWYAQVDRDGRFLIRNVPPGKYHLHAWHEASSEVSATDVDVGDNGASGVHVRVEGDRRPDNFVPDKYGKPRQRQLGY